MIIPLPRYHTKKPINANPGFQVNRSNNFSCIKMSFTAYVLCSFRLFKLKTEGQPKICKFKIKIRAKTEQDFPNQPTMSLCTQQTPTDRQMDRQTDRQTDIQSVRQTDRQTDTQSGRQTDIHILFDEAKK